MHDPFNPCEDKIGPYSLTKIFTPWGVVITIDLKPCHTRQFFLATCNATAFQAAFYKRNRLL